MTATTEIKPARTRRFRFNWVDSFLWFHRIAAIITILVGLIGSIQLFMAGEGPTLEQWRTLVISSISQGAMYGLIALGYSMVYGVLGFINFAHGEVFMAGTMVGFVAANEPGQSGFWAANTVSRWLIVLVVAMATSMSTAMLIERVAYRRCERTTPHPPHHLDWGLVFPPVRLRRIVRGRPPHISGPARGSGGPVDILGFPSRPPSSW